MHLYLGVQNKRGKLEFLSAFPSQLVKNTPQLKDLTIMAYEDDQESSKLLIQSIPNVERLQFRFVNYEPTLSHFLE